MDFWFSGNALVGGLVIGLAAITFLLFLGRIMGVSGIVSNLISRGCFTWWRLLFVLGLFAAPWVYQLFAELPPIKISSNIILLIVAGLLVGIGSALGSGCTSGHSICGISRYSPSSLLVTLLFMVAGGVTVFLVKHLLQIGG